MQFCLILIKFLMFSFLLRSPDFEDCPEFDFWCEGVDPHAKINTILIPQAKHYRLLVITDVVEMQTAVSILKEFELVFFAQTTLKVNFSIRRMFENYRSTFQCRSLMYVPKPSKDSE